ncbi:MAG: hypothetical protein CVT49_12425 [candidate division Zixibacteria bacterium HGW-Zixibacteria-1]|nr:MAG: hypothetical protein CVT49_12425 [candidate division Zixibacteria bacterium HGW-Zixibacteria-1]
MKVRLNRICFALLLSIFIIGFAVISRAGIGPFEISNKDKTATMKIQFTAQLRMEYFNKDMGGSKEREDKLTMEARRIRLSLSGVLGTPNLSYGSQLSFAPNSLELMDIYGNYSYCPCSQFRFGQFKVPFTEYRQESFGNLVMADWSILTKYFGAERQMGFAVHNGYRDVEGWGYVLGVFTGVNARASHGIGVPMIYGEERPNPSDLADPGSKAEFHPELFAKGTYYYKPENSELNVKAAFSGAWDIEPADYQDFSIRLAPELVMDYNRFKFNGIGYLGFVDFLDPEITRLSVTGLLLELTVKVNERIDLSARYSRLDIRDYILDDAHNRADSIIAAASAYYYEYPIGLGPDYIESIQKQYGSVGKLDSEDEYTVGMVYKLIGHQLKIQNDFTWTRHGYVRNDSRKDVSIRSQFQLVF